MTVLLASLRAWAVLWRRDGMELGCRKMAAQIALYFIRIGAFRIAAAAKPNEPIVILTVVYL